MKNGVRSARMIKAHNSQTFAMAAKRITALAIACISWPPLAASERSAIEFTDPSAKGSLMFFDLPLIPQEYHGVWADRLSNCYISADRGVQASISAGAIGQERVTSVEGYSDHPGVIVTLTRDGGEHRRLALDISLDGRHVQIRDLKSERENLLQKCPPPPSGYLPPNPDVRQWFEAAQQACKTRYFPDFFEAVARSREVQRQFLAPRITVLGAEGRQPIPRKQYRQLPIELRDTSYILTDRSNGIVDVVVEIVERNGGIRQVNWYQVDGAGDRIADGYSGWLLFEKANVCWVLKEQGSN